MKVLITGHTGFIGRNISRHLAMQGHEIVGLSRGLSEESCFDAQVSCDLGEPHLCESIIGHKKLKGVEMVIHASSILADNENLESFDFFYANLRIIENTVKLCKSLQHKMIINLSTVAVYPNIDGDFSEESKTFVGHNPEGLYGLSKICSENIFDFYLSRSMCVSHLRLSQVFGDGMRDDRIYSIFLNELRETNKISVWGNGERTSNFIDISKLLDILQLFIDTKNPGVYNVGDHNISYKDIAQIIINKFGDKASKIILVPEGNKSKFNLNLEKLHALRKNFISKTKG